MLQAIIANPQKARLKQLACRGENQISRKESSWQIQIEASSDLVSLRAALI